jgi:hypothetical protein
MTSKGTQRAQLLQQLELTASSKLQQWNYVRNRAHTPDLLYLMLVQILKDGSELMRKTYKHQTHKQHIEARKDLLMIRADLRQERFERPADIAEISQQIKQHDKICKRFVAANWAERTHHLTEALIEAKAQNRSRQEHQLAHQLAAQSRGPKKRRYNLAPPSNPRHLST